jgi:hypothetical protein
MYPVATAPTKPNACFFRVNYIGKKAAECHQLPFSKAQVKHYIAGLAMWILQVRPRPV